MSSTTVEQVNEPTGEFTSHDTPPKRLGLALFVICAAQLMIVLDGTIVNIALPHIETDLGFSQANLRGSSRSTPSPSAACCSSAAGSATSTAGAACSSGGVAALHRSPRSSPASPQNEAMMLAARAVQGLGGALASPNALALITTTFPAGKERNRAMGVYAAMSGAGAAIGLILGGALTEIDWRWTFFINLPIGLARRVPRAAHPHRVRGRPAARFDLPGAITSTAGLVVARLRPDPRGRAPRGATPTTLTYARASVSSLLVAFVVIETPRRAPAPADAHPRPTAPAARPTSSCSSSAPACSRCSTSSASTSSRSSATRRSRPASRSCRSRSASSSRRRSPRILIAKVDPRWISGAGAGFATLGMWGFTHLTPQSTYAAGLLPWIVVLAFGLGLIFVPLTLTAVHGVRARGLRRSPRPCSTPCSRSVARSASRR